MCKCIGRSSAGQTIALPAGQFGTLTFLGTGVNGPQPGQTFLVNYADGSSDPFTQDRSDWLSPQGFAEEAVAAVLGYSNYMDGSSPAVLNETAPRSPVPATRTWGSRRR
jgi:hypothetical protein